MSDTARAADGRDDGDSFSSAAVPTVGTVLSAVTVAALLVPVRHGADDPGLWIGAAAALVATGVFLGRRHDVLERRLAGPVAAGASFLVVVLSGYAITQGVLGSVVVPGLEWSVSLLFVAFFVASGGVGVGIADYAGVSGRGLKHRLARSTEMLLLAGIGLFAISVASLFVALPVFLVAGEPTDFQWTIIEYVSFAVGLGAVTAGYLALRDHDVSFIDLERPTLRTVGWIVGGLILILAANLGVSALMTVFGIEGSEHTTTQQAAENPDLLLVIIPAMVLFVGPFEELLYRNVIQKTLYGTFSRYGAVVVASVVFTAVHISAYATAGADQILASLSLLFVLSLILGTIYERTDNLLVPALVHGCYNAAIFLTLL
ncbi:CPBP family intramembrane metalloprotease [Natronorubrum sp. JWXQ-INN-674]|uniref:CPBP family intramembrane metalloprotease n=1 Tax=Natronorubrum halalkaliphilum TaxID=2691917 RepID=A0A6B0VSJ8_9EURY|nr:CPBP family intramembrane glutamic endopeptidase [Natronorubrum halalkaliphilum]MXV63479.1 CPBP family intramembrane metalloprotease [Natronorubrum halalkaliphilum]